MSEETVVRFFAALEAGDIDTLRQIYAPDAVLQQHVLRGRLPYGTDVELPAAMYLQVRDGHVTRIEEYLDSAKRSSIRAAREAISG